MNYKRSDVLMDTTMSASEFRTIFPDLAPGEGPIPECYFYLTIGELAIENCKAKSKVIKKPSTLETKLKDNAIKIHTVKSWDNNTMDNLKDKLHPLRFDRCPTISSEEMFVKAAHFYDDKELLPINTYDLSRLDLTNKISMKGFEELHKPDSTILSVKMFSPENVKKTNGGLSSLNVVRDESGNQTVLTSLYLEDIENIRNFKAAFFGLYVAKDRVVPWDKSLQPLWKFFLVHDWLKDIPNSFGYNTNEDQGSFCTSFTDSVLQTNAIRFSQKQPHMSFSELDAHFRSFCTFNQKCSFVQLVPVVNKNVDGKMKQVIKETWTPSEPGASYIAVRTICRVFNSDKNCKNSFDSKSRKCHDTNGGNKYLHICNVKMPNGRPCGQGHKNSSHPKN